MIVDNQQILSRFLTLESEFPNHKNAIFALQNYMTWQRKKAL